MAGLVPAIHVFVFRSTDVDARDKRGHDDGSMLLDVSPRAVDCDPHASRDSSFL
jgi:hypothetical protein